MQRRLPGFKWHSAPSLAQPHQTSAVGMHVWAAHMPGEQHHSHERILTRFNHMIFFLTGMSQKKDC